MRETDTHLFFWGGSIFSNFHIHPHTYKGHRVHTSEQSFMLEKAWEFDPSLEEQILATRRPEQAKALGRKVKNYDDVKWGAIRYQKMVDVLMVKFSIPELKQELLATGNKTLVEASPYDRIWGIGLLEDNPLVDDETNWRGQNLLGKALMEVREALRQS